MFSDDNGVVIACGGRTSVALIASHIGSCYKFSKMCDLVIVTGDDKAVFCHKLVLCSLSKTLLDMCVGDDAGNETTCIYLPDFSYEAVKSLIGAIYDGLGKQVQEIPKTELTSILGIEDLPLAFSKCSVKIECDPGEVALENEKSVSSIKRRIAKRTRASENEEEKLTEGRRGRRSTKRQCYKEEEIADEDDDLEGSMQDIFEAAKSEMSNAGAQYDTAEEWQPELDDLNEADAFATGGKDSDQNLKEEISPEEEITPEEKPLKSSRKWPDGRRWQPKEYKHNMSSAYGQIRKPRNLSQKRERASSKSPAQNTTKKLRRSKARRTQRKKSESEEDSSNDDNDYIPDLKREEESSDEEQPTNDYSSCQGKAIKIGIRQIVSGCKPINIDVRSAGGDFHIIPAFAAHKIKPDGSKSNRSKIDFTYKQYMVKPSFAAVVGVARAGDLSEHLLGRPLAWSYPSGEEEMNGQYDAVTDAYQKVFGFSEEDVHCNKMFINAHFGTYSAVPHEYKDPKRAIGTDLYRRYKEMDPAALNHELEQKKEKHPAYERNEKKPTLTLQGTRCQLQLDPTLETKSFEGIMVIAWHINKIKPSESSYRKAIGKVLNFDCDVVQNKRHYNTMWEQPSKVLELFMRVLRDVWMNGSTWLPLSKHMFSLFKTVFERACALRLLSNIIVGNLPERMCTHCGKTFTIMSGSELRIYTEHMKKHAIEKSFSLDCGCTNVGKIGSTKARGRHMKLHHSDGKFVKCPKCVEVIEKDKLSDHIAKNHVENHVEQFCEICGKSCPHK